MGGANTALSTEGNMFDSVDVGDVQSSHGLEFIGIAIRLMGAELGELVGSKGVAVQQ